MCYCVLLFISLDENRSTQIVFSFFFWTEKESELIKGAYVSVRILLKILCVPENIGPCPKTAPQPLATQPTIKNYMYWNNFILLFIPYNLPKIFK